MRTLALLIVPVAIVSVGVSADQTSGKAEYKFTFQPGEKYSLLTTTEQKIAQMVKGREQLSAQTTRRLADFDIENVEPDGAAWVKYTFRHVAMRVTRPTGSFEFDSAQSQAKVPPQALPAVLTIGESLYLRVTPQGRIDKINGLATLVGSIKSKLPDMPGREQILQGLNSQYSEDALRASLEEYLAVFPDPGRKVAVGDTWTRTVQDPGDDFAVQTTWRLKETGSVDIIEVNLVINPGLDTGKMQRGRTAIKHEVAGRGQGLIRLDPANGRIIKSTVTQDIIEQAKATPTGSIRRVQDPVEPAKHNILTTVEMTVRKPDPNDQSGQVLPVPPAAEPNAPPR